MGLDQKRLQKKKAKKAAKNKIRRLKQKKEQLVENLADNAMILSALQAPIYHCWEPEQIFNGDQGIGTIVVTRKTQTGDVLMAVFLADVFCLGVKNVYIRLMSKEKYNSILDEIREHESLKSIHPSCARKLVEGAVEYAKELGLSPHEDYRSAIRIFRNIEVDDCPRSFKFGKDGKPFYISGPKDSILFSKQVIEKLTYKLGPDGFDYLVHTDDQNIL